MISDERLDKMEKSISESLNEEATLAKVDCHAFVSIVVLIVRVKGGLNAVNARVYAVKVYTSYQKRRDILVT